jgi:hypothetical protein
MCFCFMSMCFCLVHFSQMMRRRSLPFHVNLKVKVIHSYCARKDLESLGFHKPIPLKFSIISSLTDICRWAILFCVTRNFFFKVRRNLESRRISRYRQKYSTTDDDVIRVPKDVTFSAVFLHTFCFSAKVSGAQLLDHIINVNTL